MKNRLYRIAALLLLSLCIFTLFRAALYLVYSSDFSNLTNAEVLASFVLGLRIDIITLFTCFCLPSLIVLLPISRNKNPYIHAGLLFVCGTVLFLLSMMLLGDFIYFNHVHRHMAGELFLLKNDFSSLFGLAASYWYLIVLAVIWFFVLMRLCWAIHKISLSGLNFSFANLGVFVLVFLAFFAGIRGKIDGKPFAIVDAYATDKVSSGNLALNGVYSTFRRAVKADKPYRHTTDQQALAATQALLFDPKFEFTHPQYPLLRQLKPDAQKAADQHNVVIVLLESWSSIFVDSFADNQFGVTPHFDQLAKEGLRFTNFYANGQRSIDGITALFSGIPRLQGINPIGSGLELSNISLLGNLAKQNGYDTLAMQSSKRGSFRLDSVTKLAGFDQYYGAEDMPELGLETSGRQPHFGAWDHNTLSLYFDKINTLKPPFLAFAFTSSTHVPYVSPGAAWEKYPHDENNIFGFLNTLSYSDQALGTFMEKAKTRDWYDNTVFIFLADHTLGFGDNKKDFAGTDFSIAQRALENMRIPMLIYAPGIIRAGRDARIASQADLMPSLVDLLHWKGQFSSLSNSMFSQRPGFALFANDPIVGFVRDEGFVKHSLHRALENTFNQEQSSGQLLSAYQSLTRLLRENKWAPGAAP